MRSWCALLVLVACRAQPGPPTAASTDAGSGPADLAAKIAPAIVTIHTADRDGELTATGAGFIVGADGLIATCHHVIGEGRPIVVELADGRRFDVTVIRAFDRAQDVALVRIGAEGLPTLTVDEGRPLRQGEPVIAFGHPHGLDNSVTTGAVAAMREYEGRSLIQLSMPIEPGNSGGPVVDEHGRVIGVVSMKSMVQRSLGFAVPIDALRRVHEKPNPVPMARWRTIGALDETKWSTLFGARWRQRAGRIVVDRPGRGMAGRSLLLSNDAVTKRPYVVSADVQLGAPDGAAGIAFASNAGHVHYAFYPTRGRLRLTRFEGPDVYSWRVLLDETNPNFRPLDFNRLEVRHEVDKLSCYVNGHLVGTVEEQTLPAGRVGYVKFRDTSAQMKHLEVRRSNEPRSVSSSERLLDEARALEWKAAGLRREAQRAHEQAMTAAIVAALDETPPDLLRATLLVARLDNPDVDVEAYVREVDRIARDIALRIPPGTASKVRFDAVRQYLFAENGFHGSRDEYHHRSNSYLNEVMDDREGLPITLSILVIEVAHRLGLPVVGVALPGHFVVRLEDDLFDPFDGGRRVPTTVAAALVRRHRGRPAFDEDFASATPRAIVTRVLRNLLKAARRANDRDAQLRYLGASLAIDPLDGPTRFDRAQLMMRSGDNDGALHDLEQLLGDAPDGVDLAEVERWRDLVVGRQR